MKVKQQGFTLIELLITLAISGTLIAGLGQILLQSQQTYKTQQALSHMMEDGRYILEVLTKETRRIGYLRNRFAAETSMLTAVGNDSFVFVLDDGGDGNGAFGSGITLNRGEYIHGDYNAYSFDGTPNNVNKLIFRYQLNDACDLGAASTTLNLCPSTPTYSATSPCTKDIGLDDGEDPTVDRHVVSIYLYVAVDPLGNPVLYCEAKRDIVTRVIIDPTDATTDMWLATTAKTSVAKPLLSNVERLLVLYGVDTDGDNATNVYLRADDVTALGSDQSRNCTTGQNGWYCVTNIRLYVVLRSEATNLTKSDSMYQIDGQPVPSDIPSERRLYRVFSTTITPRVSIKHF